MSDDLYHVPPKRLRAADVIETLENALHAALTRTAEPYVTVELTRNAKGETQVSTKVTAPHGHDVDELREYAENVRSIAVDAHEKTLRRFPTSSGTITNDAPPLDAA